MFKLRIAGLIFCIATAIFLVGCNNTNENSNATANANAAMPAANENRAAANANSHANDNRRAGLTREDYEKDKERYKKEAKDSGRTIGNGINDGWLWVKARYDLAAATDLQDSTINVDVNDGTVTLTGTVPTAAQKTRAEQIAKSVEGVKAVVNQIKVVPANANANANANRNDNLKSKTK